MEEIEIIKEFAKSKGYDIAKLKYIYKGGNAYILLKSVWNPKSKTGPGSFAYIKNGKCELLTLSDAVEIRKNGIKIS